MQGKEFRSGNRRSCRAAPRALAAGPTRRAGRRAPAARSAARTSVDSGSVGEGLRTIRTIQIGVRSEFLESVENHENQNSEKATNDPLYKKGPQKNREKGNRRRQEGTGRKPL